MTPGKPHMGRWGRYLARMREAGVASSFQILASRTKGYMLWPSCALARSLGRHLAPAELCLPLEAARSERKLTLLWEPEELAIKAEALRGERSALGQGMVQAGNRVLQDGIPLLGWGFVPVAPPVPWHLDTRVDVAWPEVFHKRIDILREGVVCDVKFPWERSRLQVLPLLAQAWIASGEARFLETTLDILADWSRANPPGYGVNWTCSMEVAIRAINLGVAANLIQGDLNQDGWNFIRDLLRSHERHIRWNLELSEVNGNHLFFDYLGIALVCLQLDGPHSASFWNGAKVLAEETDRQFHRDGVHLEHATSYHRLVLEGVLLFVHATRALESPSIQLMRGVAKRAWTFLDAIALEDGSLPSIGDDDSGNVLLLGDSRGNHGGGVLELAAAAGVGGGRSRTSVDEVVRFWFTPHTRNPVSCREAEGSEEVWELQAFEEAGFFVIRGRGLNLVLRAGPSGLQGRGSHDHNDQLALVLSLDGTPILVDPGTRTYTEGLSLHQLDLATARHNTLSVKGMEQAPIHRGSVTCAVRSNRGVCEHFNQTSEGRVTWVGRVPYGGEGSHWVHSRKVDVRALEGSGFVVEVLDRLDGVAAEGTEAFVNFILDPAVSTQLAEPHRIQLESSSKHEIQVEGTHPWLHQPDSISSEYGGGKPTIRISTPMSFKAENLIRISIFPIGSRESSFPEGR